MKANFERCLSFVLKHEGGYVNDPQDPGGETNMGISKRSYPSENMKGMTRARAGLIYRRDYWDAVRGDELPAGLDLVAFDAAVNSGVSRGAKWLQEAVGVPADGKVGPQTLAAANAAHPEAVIDRACGLRLAFLRKLPTWGRYGKGWGRRVEDVRATAITMATQSLPPAKPAPSIKSPITIILIVVAVLAAAFFILKG